jgi:hypothetical protein
MKDLTEKAIKILDLLYDAKALLEDIEESELYNEVQYIIHAFKLEMVERNDLTKEQKELIYN